jgi:hypothetical protein
MKVSRILSILVAAFVPFVSMPAHATSEHDYARDEYAIIRDGLAPNKQLSLAAHGDGDGGREHFHVWLMAEPAHRKIVALDDISGRLDTGPDAYYAFWSADSRRVAVTFRSDRHVVELNIYETKDRHARLISGPSLFRDVTSRDPGVGDDERRSVPEFESKGTRRFLIKERRLFVTSDPGFARMMGAYGKVTDKRDDGSWFVEFSAEADCILMPGGRYRILDLRVGKFGD